ncbi:MAG: hypothetical protein QNJ55_31555 [Xenococcus sp. MO_188.B8]|nr:hypothetical protein [Xenococcus sp. MO_188.B8]
MNEPNLNNYLEGEIFDLKTEIFTINQELELVKKQVNQKGNSLARILLILKILIVILLGINAQSGNFKFSGEQIMPIIEQLTGSPEVGAEANF